MERSDYLSKWLRWHPEDVRRLEEDDFDRDTRRTWSIWCEGYRATGEYGRAHCMGQGLGDTFKEACVQFFEQRADLWEDFDQEHLTYWGCRLFPDETPARRAFG